MKDLKPGFTLIEIMVATAIAILIVGAVYASFRTSLKVYQKDQTRLVMLQRCRATLDKIAKDLNNFFYVEGDEQFTLLTQDYADPETAMDQDMISFVSIVEPDIKRYLAQQESTTSRLSESEETGNQLPSDLARITYVVSKSLNNENVNSLLRIQTTELDPEEINNTISEMQTLSRSEELKEMMRESMVAEYISGFNIRYYDGTDWVDEWDMSEQNSLPRAIEITLTVTDADVKVVDPTNRKTTLTQAIVVNLPFSRSQAAQASAASSTGQVQTQ